MTKLYKKKRKKVHLFLHRCFSLKHTQYHTQMKIVVTTKPCNQMPKRLCWARFDFVRIKIVTAVHARLWLWFQYKFYKHRNMFSPQGSSLLTTHFVQPAKETKMKAQNQWFCFAPMILHSNFKVMTSGTDWLHRTATSPSSPMLHALPLLTAGQWWHLTIFKPVCHQ